MTKERLDYLKIIHKLCEYEGSATHKRICQETNNSGASVSQMMKKLEKSDLIYYENNDIFLTVKGNEEAEKILSKHRLWELFLHKYLKISWDDIHMHADKLEHATNDELMDKLNIFLGNPTSCPHGGVIFENSKKNNNTLLLSEAKENENYLIHKIWDEKELLIHLNDKNLNLKDTIKIVKKNQFDNSIVLECKGKLIELTKKVSDLIKVVAK